VQIIPSGSFREVVANVFTAVSRHIGLRAHRLNLVASKSLEPSIPHDVPPNLYTVRPERVDVVAGTTWIAFDHVEVGHLWKMLPHEPLIGPL